jgi:hypothetical protein
MKKILLIALIGLSLTSCTKEDDNVSVPTFDVSLEKHTYSLGDTVRFKFSGDADYLTMYSGQAGSNYAFKDRTRAEGIIRCDIFANLRNTPAGAPRSLSVFVTTELNPLRDSASVFSANWIDISDRFKIPFGTATGVQVSLDTATLNDIAKPNKPLFFALRVKTPNHPTSPQDRWTIARFNVTNKLEDGTVNNVATIGIMGWKFFNILNLPTYGFSLSGTSIINATAAPRGSGDTENWAVSGPVYPDAAIRDYPKTIKNQIELIPEEYPFVYTKKGTYKAVFVALNSRNGQTTTTTKEVEITIE